MTTEKYKGKTAKEWFKLHEVLRRDVARLVKERDEARDAYTNMSDFAKSKGLDTRTSNRR